MVAISSIDDLEGGLRDAEYLPERGLATALFLSRSSRSRCCSRARRAWARPRLRRRWPRPRHAADPAAVLRGAGRRHAVYEWNYSRQLLHIRAAQEGRFRGEELFGPEFLIRRPLLEAIESPEPVVLLIDEIDRADEEFEAFLLEVLSDFQITIPEIGTISRPSQAGGGAHVQPHPRAARRLKRRCLYHWIGHPALEREVAIVSSAFLAFPSGLRRRRPLRPRPPWARPREASRRGRDDRLGERVDGAGTQDSTRKSSSRRWARC